MAILVMSCEVLIFMLYKVVRRDFRYWLPLPRGWSIFASLLMRIVVKVLADFTGELFSAIFGKRATAELELFACMIIISV